MAEALRVTVTGASGHLGSHLLPLLVAEGFEIRGLDCAEPTTVCVGVEYRRIDLAQAEQARAGLEGADLVVHAASIHPWKPYTDDQYLDSNIKGTWNLYRALAELGIGKVVLTSSIAAIGYGGPASWPVTEDARFPLGDLYSFTKHAQEDIARMHADALKVRTIALRPPAFMPLEPLETGFRLTGAYALVEDMASAHLAAVQAMAGLRQPGAALAPFEAIFTTNALPYQTEDAALLAEDGSTKPLVRKYWPEAYEWLIERGYEGTWLPAVYDLSKAQRLLGWQPLRNFDRWFAETAPRL